MPRVVHRLSAPPKPYIFIGQHIVTVHGEAASNCGVLSYHSCARKLTGPAAGARQSVRVQSAIKLSQRMPSPMRFVRSRNFLISSLFVMSLMLLVVAANMPSLAQGAPQQVPPSGPPPAANPGPAPGRGAGGGGGFPSAAEMKGKTAGQVFKNLQVLSGVPAEDFLPSMNY